MKHRTTLTFHVEREDIVIGFPRYITTADGYDGAPDSNDPFGDGDTPLESLAHLIEQMIDIEGEEADS